MQNTGKSIAQYLVDYCTLNNISYRRHGNFILMHVTGQYTVVYYPESKAVFYSGMKVLDDADADTIRYFLDFIR